MALQYIRQLYSLDTLDTRFVIPATAPPKEALDKNGRDKSRNHGDHGQPARWNTSEFYFYYVVISASVFVMFKSVIDVSKSRCLSSSCASLTAD
jgi:hypothetical protein